MRPLFLGLSNIFQTAEEDELTNIGLQAITMQG